MLFEERADATGVVFGFVEAAHEFAVTVLEELTVEDGFEIEGRIGVVAGAFVFESAFSHEALVESGLGEGGEESDHGGDDAGVLDEFELAFEDVLGVVVEADDESAHDFESGLLESLDGADEVTSAVEEFAAFLEAFERGGFDTDEDLFESGLDHERAEFGVIGEVDRGFREEAEWGSGLLAPLDEGAEEGFSVVAVTDEIVIDDEDHIAPAGVLERFEFGDELLGGFRSGDAAVHDDDIAELAIIGAAAGELHGHGDVVFELDEVPAWGGDAGHGWAAGWLV